MVAGQLRFCGIDSLASEQWVERVPGLADWLGNRSRSMKKQNFSEMVNLIVKEDDRYAKESYSFLKEALYFF